MQDNLEVKAKKADAFPLQNDKTQNYFALKVMLMYYAQHIQKTMNVLQFSNPSVGLGKRRYNQ